MFEKDCMNRFIAAKNEARKLLDQGKRSGAVKLINVTAAEIWNKAAEMLEI